MDLRKKKLDTVGKEGRPKCNLSRLLPGHYDGFGNILDLAPHTSSGPKCWGKLKPHKLANQQIPPTTVGLSSNSVWFRNGIAVQRPRQLTYYFQDRLRW